MAALSALTGALLAACASSPKQAKPKTGKDAALTPIKSEYALPDKAAYLQKDPRWANVRLGGSNEPLSSDGCLVTAVAMSLQNLGIKTDPGDLTQRLKKADGFTNRGWLVWSGIDRVTEGAATARFYKSVSTETIDSCMADGFYPLASFKLPNGRTHWALILRKSSLGYHMRDPLHPSKDPLVFTLGDQAFKSVRCVGLSKPPAKNFASQTEPASL